MDKVERNGKIAVLISPGFGAGWITWNSEYPECLFDPEIVEMVEKKEHDKIGDFARSKYGNDFYPGGGYQLQIVWLDKGTKFRVEEYDGSESVTLVEDLTFEA
ncbi:MAG: hypothetical protein KGO96_07085 [Elusimicrobia bacterium]|nr:hypothetical protein [Elusimicrobiota bacterium]